MQVQVIRSPRRRKTVEARLVDGTLEVRVPARLTREEEEECVADMVGRFLRKRDTEAIDLEARAASLARRYDLPRPAKVRWVQNQKRRWGSCSVHTGEIRLSAVLATYPTWVLDYVLVHEMAHLIEADHGPAFHALVARYPKAERAEGFLIAKGMGDDPEPAADEPRVPDLGTDEADPATAEAAAVDAVEAEVDEVDEHEVDVHDVDEHDVEVPDLPDLASVVQPTLF